jgi:uncharacterized protein (TIGR00369 family)
MESLNDRLLARLESIVPGLKGIEIPPRSWVDMEGEFVAWDEEKNVLTARFPVRERYRNPLGAMQGGMIVAAVDNVFGPLSYLVAPPSLTQQLNTAYIRAVGPELEYIEVTARVEHKTRRFLYLSAQVTDPQGELLALSQASCLILRGPRQ